MAQERWTLYEGDCLDVLKRIPDNSIDAVVTDPPYGLSKEPDIEEVLRHWLAGDDYKHRGGGFMGKTWDSFVPGPAVWREVCRVLKPGGHILCFAGTRTVDLMGIAIRLGGFEIRDCLQWLYGSGFPKSLDVSKAIDKMLGAEREKIRVPASEVRNPKSIQGGHGIPGGDRPWMREALKRGYHELDGDMPVTPEAKQWKGWGTHLKPANEPIILARKPLSEATVAENVLKWGTGAINIEGCRIGTETLTYRPKGIRPGSHNYVGDNWNPESLTTTVCGRFPANILLDEEAAAMLDEQSGYSKSSDRPRHNNEFKSVAKGRDLPHTTYGHADEGGASRFFYVAKASRSERTMGGEVENNHPTVKPIDLMRYLCRLVTPPGGVVLDPFAGSGSTLIAALLEGFRCIGIEKEAEYCDIIRDRITVAFAVPVMLRTKPPKKSGIGRFF